MPITISGDGGIAGLELSEFGDVTGTPTDNQALTWDAATSQWVPETILDTVNAGIGSNAASALKTDGFTTSSTMTDVPGLSVTITPTSATSKVLVLVTTFVTSDSANRGAAIRVQRNGSDIGNGTSSGTPYAGVHNGGDGQYDMNAIAWSILDSPATTSTVTYKVRLGRTLGAGTAYLNRRSATDLTSSSSITVIEVAA